MRGVAWREGQVVRFLNDRVGGTIPSPAIVEKPHDLPLHTPFPHFSAGISPPFGGREDHGAWVVAR